MGLIGIGGTAVAIGGACVLGAVAHGAFHPRSRLFGPVVWRGSSDRPEIALTFDDGPTPGLTDAIVDALGEAGAKATFFVIGRRAREHPRLLRRLRDQGHLVANHTLDHHRHGLFHRDAYWRAQIVEGGRAVEAAIGLRPLLFRPPMGFRSAHVVRAARGQGCVMVTWSRRGLDTVSRSPQAIARRVLSGLEPGEIVALHDGIDGEGRRPNRATAEAVPLILSELRQRGLRAVRLDELLGIEAYAGS